MNNSKNRLIKCLRSTENNNKIPLNFQLQKIIKWLYVLISHSILYSVFIALFIVSIVWMYNHHDWLVLLIVSICCIWILSVIGAFVSIYIIYLVRTLPIQQIYKTSILNITKVLYVFNILAIPTFLLLYKINKLKKEDPKNLEIKQLDTSVIDNNS